MVTSAKLKRMEQKLNQEPYFKDSCVCAIGVFDGLHLGHQALLEAAAEDAASRGDKLVVVTFDHDPDELFCPDLVHKLLTNAERLGKLEEQADDVLALPFTRELASLEYDVFLDYLLGLLPGLKAIHVGTNFHCGAHASGGIPEITAWGLAHEISVVAEPLLDYEGEAVSASRIRALLAAGDVKTAAILLTRSFALTGEVIHGDGRGRSLGFATANVEVDGSLAMLGPYVYAAYALLAGKRYKAAVSIGEPPTYSPADQEFNPFFFEAHLLDFDEELYNQQLTLEFIENLRPMRKFDNQEELIATVMGNINWVRENL